MIFHLFTDGACQPNPGEGGWAFIVYPETHSEKRVARCGYEANTTNNRMEITAVLKGLEYLSTWKGCASESLRNSFEIMLFSDSKYLINGLKIWMHNWVKNDWKKKNDKVISNDDIWRQLYSMYKGMTINCQYIKGHSGHLENEECDKLAIKQIKDNAKA